MHLLDLGIEVGAVLAVGVAFGVGGQLFPASLAAVARHRLVVPFCFEVSTFHAEILWSVLMILAIRI